MVALEQIGAPAFTLAVCPDGKFRYAGVNAAYTARTGLAADAVAGRTPFNIQDPLTAAWLCEFFGDAVERRRPVEYDIRVALLLGDVWWRTALTPMMSDDGTVVGLLGICQDVTTEKRLAAELTARAQQLEFATRMVRGATWQFDVFAERFETSPDLALLVGEEQPRDLAWAEWLDRVLDEDRDLVSCDRLLEAGGGEQTVEFRFRDTHGQVRWARCRRGLATACVDEPVVCGVVVDITAEREHTAALEVGAVRDLLTGLMTRRGLKRDLPRPMPPGTALVLVDLDGFREINDTHGHLRGDAVLTAVTARLIEAAGAGARVARLGGDEFVAVLRADDSDEAQRLRRRIAGALTFTHGTAEGAVPVSASTGVAWTAGAQAWAALMAEADEDLYCLKRARTAAARAQLRASRAGQPGECAAAA